ncbi:MAG: hypothetical protein U1E46_07320 [Hyphomicrobiales bacterium]
MKNALIILCILMVLFGGGCVVMIVSIPGVWPLAVAPLALIVLNAILLAALTGRIGTSRVFFYLMGAADILIGLASVVVQAGGSVYDLLAFLFFGAKGLFTILYARSLAGGQA